MAETIRAAVKIDVERTEIRTFARPPVPVDGALLRVEASGVGGSDPELYRWANHAPVIMGHESVGVIDEIGTVAAERWGVKVGDRVALHEYLPCWHCHWCRQGDFRLCEVADFFLVKDRFSTLRFGMSDCRIAPHLWGGFAEYLYLPFNSVMHKIPKDLPAKLATLAIPLGNGFQWAVLDGGAGPGKTVLVFGPGQQGLGCVFAAKAAGAFCVVLVGHTRDQSRLDLGKKVGADVVIDAEREDLRKRLHELTGGRGVDVVVDTTGDPTGQVAADAVALAAKGAQLNLNGLGQKVSVGDIKKLYLNVRAPRGHSYTAVEMALRYLHARQDVFLPLCSHSYPLDKTDTAIKATAAREVQGAVHVTVDPWG
jgi:threonine dehydrogenase-like Zn-dependent dehydrogenase